MKIIEGRNKTTKGEFGMATMFEIRDELAEEVRKIQLSGMETSDGWKKLQHLREVDYKIRLVTDTIYIGVRK